MSEEDEQPARAHVRRKKTVYDMVVGAGSVAGAMAAIGVTWTAMTDQLPFEKKLDHAADIAQLVEKNYATEQLAKTTAEAMQDIKRTGLLNLQLQLQSRVEVIGSAMDGLPKNGQAWLGLLNEKNTMQQQLEEIKRQLNR